MAQNEILGRFPADQRNQILQTFVEQPKSHAESREFSKSGHGLSTSITLAFVDDAVSRRMPLLPLVWNVRQATPSVHQSLSGRLLLDGNRIRGVDRENVPRSYKFTKETVSEAFWHENILSFDRKGILQNQHASLVDWHASYTADQFAVKTAERWNIQTWREQEDLDLWKQ